MSIYSKFSTVHLEERAKMRRCGSCDKWMKSSLCPREHNVNGWNKGPSSHAFPCKEYIDGPEMIKIKKELTLRNLSQEY